MKAVEAHMSKQAHQKAKAIVLKWLPGLKTVAESKAEFFCLKTMMEIDVTAGRYDDAVRMGQYAVKRYRSSGIELYQLLARAYIGREDFDEAAQCMDTALSLWNGSARSALPADKRSDAAYLDLVAFAATCLFDGGMHREAAEKVNQVMHLPGAGEHLSIVTAYARFALQYNKLEDALNAVFKVIVAIGTKDIKSQPKVSRKLLSDFFSTKGAVELFQSRLPAAKSSGSGDIFAFLGSTAKDFSQFDTAVRLYQLALTADPSNASFILNLAHVLEMKADLMGALTEITAFCHRNASLGINTNGTGSSLTCAQFADVFSSEERARQLAESCSAVWVGGDDGYTVITLTGEEAPAVARGSVTFSSKELDLLAVFALAVKLMYLMDKRVFVPAVIRTVETVRQLSAVKLHETNVRNELAYYQDIAQVICFYYSTDPRQAAHFHWPACLSDASNSNSSVKQIFVVGDSHCLSSAWADITVRGQRRRFVPRLVTGLKQWHLRDASTFHPKQTFHNMLSAVPDESDVVMLVGEIDCREGLLLAVEKDLYPDLAAAVQRTVTIFIKVLTQLRKKRRFKIWVHPVVPVLEPTRSIVLLFNQHYKAAVEAMRDPGVQWMDFLQQLLTVDARGRTQLREEFKHDGTHLRPGYVQLIEAAMNSSTV